jgi:metal-responsive CopG/Arc/MetJ family transcriptional regulator
LAIQLPEELMHAVDRWATDHGISRSEAITDLLGKALALARPTTKDIRAKAAELAAKEIDKVSNSSAADEERQKRKRRLLEGPREFRSKRR